MPTVIIIHVRLNFASESTELGISINMALAHILSYLLVIETFYLAENQRDKLDFE